MMKITTKKTIKVTESDVIFLFVFFFCLVKTLRLKVRLKLNFAQDYEANVLSMF